MELLPLSLFHDILYIHSRREREIQIDCLANKSVTVIFGRWINGFDGCCRLKQRDWLETREIGLNPRELNVCELHVRLHGFVSREGPVKNVCGGVWRVLTIHFFLPLLLQVIDCHRFPNVCQPASLLLDVIFNIWLFNSMELEVIFAVLHLVLENKTF